MYRFLVFCTLFLILSCQIHLAQGQSTGKVAGKVSAATGEALAGVSVAVKNSPGGTATDGKGRFEIAALPTGSHVLQFSLIGFEPQEKAVLVNPGQQTEISIRLQEKALDMQGVEITGKTETRRVNEQAYAVTAISMKELQNSSQDAKEVLNRVSGVKVQEEGGLGSAISFTLNGFSGDQVKFFLDGIPMDNFGSSLSLSDLPVNSIDRIEVYKGVVPVWLGTDALGGGVNIITNRKPQFLDASYSVGSFNTHRISVNGAHTSAKSGFTLRGNVNYNYSDNDYKVWVPIKEGGNIVDSAEVRRFHDRYRSGTVKLETGWANRKFADNLLFGVLASGNDKQVQTGTTMNKVYGGITRNSRSVVPTLKYSKDNLFLTGLNVSLYSAYNQTTSEIIDTLRGVTFNWLGEKTYTPGSTDGELRRTYATLTDHDFNSQFNAGYAFSTKHSVAFNFAYSYFYRRAFDTEDPDNIDNKFPKALTKQVAGLAYKFDANEKWSTTLFGKFYLLQTETSKQYDYAQESQRTDVFKANKQNYGYGVATSYFLLKDLQLKASYEHTYRMPWANEIFGDGQFTLPNPELGPEQSDNLNAGAAYAFKLGTNHRLQLESSFLYRETKNLIYPIVTINSPETNYENLGNARTLGVEGGLKYQWKELIRLGGNVTFQDITDQTDSIYNRSYTFTGYQYNYNRGSRAPNIPYLFGSATAGLTFKDAFVKESVWGLNYYYNFTEQFFLSWTGLGYRNDKLTIPRQVSHNLELSCSLQQGKYNVAIECRNLTDARLYDKFYLQKPGRAFYLKLRYVL